MELLQIARVFRASLEELKRDRALPSHMDRFPVICCGVTSELLGEYLAAAGVSSMYVAARRPDASHAWLEIGDVVIDLTADQFDGRTPVFVGSKDHWYHSWSEEFRRVARMLPNGTHYGKNRAVLMEILRRTQLPDHGISGK